MNVVSHPAQPALRARPIAAGDWVSPDGALVDRRIFADRAIYDREIATVFAKSWLFLGHESQVPKSGDFVTTYMGETPVIVARGNDGEVHVSINSCRHRGLRVCRSDSGNAPAFACPYHGWVYGNKGELRGWPRVSGWEPVADKSEYGLVRVRCEHYHGMLFGNFDADAAPLTDFIGDFAFYLDAILDRSAAGVQFRPGIQKRRLQTNWKMPTENLIGDRQHGEQSHRSVFFAMPAERREQLAGLISNPEIAYQVAVRNGHGAICSYHPNADPDDRTLLPAETTIYPPGTLEAMQALQAPIRARLGEARYRTKPNAMAMFPNLTFLPFSFSITVAHPRGPGASDLWTYVFYDRAWPTAIQDAFRKHYYKGFGPSGCFEHDDAENWQEQAAAARFPAMADYPFSYEGGLEEGFGAPHPELAGLVSSAHCDAPQRSFYCRWQEMVR